jgi:ketosteroid isomerase-like protein
VQGAGTVTDADLTRQREIVDAFMAAARRGDFEALLMVLDPDVVLRGAVPKGASMEIRGAAAVARQALTFAQRRAVFARPALVNGTPGLVVASGGRAFSVMGFAIHGGKIVEIDILADPARLERLDLTSLKD